MSAITMGKTMRQDVVKPSKVFGNENTQHTSMLEFQSVRGQKTSFLAFYTILPTDLPVLATGTYGYFVGFRIGKNAADDLRLCLSQMETALSEDSATPEQRDLVAKPVPPSPPTPSPTNPLWFCHFRLLFFQRSH